MVIFFHFFLGSLNAILALHLHPIHPSRTFTHANSRHTYAHTHLPYESLIRQISGNRSLCQPILKCYYDYVHQSVKWEKKTRKNQKSRNFDVFQFCCVTCYLIKWWHAIKNLWIIIQNCFLRSIICRIQLLLYIIGELIANYENAIFSTTQNGQGYLMFYALIVV